MFKQTLIIKRVHPADCSLHFMHEPLMGRCWKKTGKNDDLNEAPSTVTTASSPQISLDIEDAVTVDKKGGYEDNFDETSQKKQTQERPCMRYFVCTLLFTSVIFGILGTTIYLAVLETNEKPLPTSGGNSNSAFPRERPTIGPKPDGLRSELSDTEVSSLQTENDVENVCPGNWTYYNKRCYHFSRTPVHISDAEEYCSNEGGTPLNINTETKAIREFMMAEIRKFVGCCLYDFSLRRNDTGILENIDEEIANSLSIPYDPERSIMDDIGHLADDNSLSVTRLPLLNQHSLNSHLPTSAVAPNVDDHISLLDTSKITRQPYTSTPAPPYGFWLGACGYEHNYLSTTAGNSYQTTNIFDSWLKKETPQPTQSDTEITQLNTETTQPNIVDRPDATSANTPEAFPRIRRSVAKRAHISAQNHVPAPQKQNDQDGKVSIEMKISALEIFCRKYEPYLPEWRETGCNGSSFQICERTTGSF